LILTDETVIQRTALKGVQNEGRSHKSDIPDGNKATSDIKLRDDSVSDNDGQEQIILIASLKRRAKARRALA